MLVEAEKSSLLTSIVFGKIEAKEKLSLSQVWKTIPPPFLRSTLSPPSPGLLFLLLHNSRGLRVRSQPAAQRTWNAGKWEECLSPSFSLWLCS